MSKIAKNKPQLSEAKSMQQERPTLPAVQYDNPWLEAADEAGGEFGRILKFVKGEWMIGEDSVPEGTEYVAHIDQVARGWVKFEDGARTDHKIMLVASGNKLPNREELGDTDKKKWEADDEGNPRDPWVKQWFLPLTAVEGNDCVVYITSSKGGIGAIGSLCRIYGRSDRKGLLPIIALKVRSYKHSKYGKIETPDLPIAGWHGTSSTPTTANAVQPPPNTGGPAADFNDPIHTIPY